MSHAAKAAFVTVDAISETSLFETEERAAGVLPALYVGKVCVAPNGSWPLPFWNGAEVDDTHMRRYKEMAKSDAGYQDYLDQFVMQESVPA